MRACFPFRSKSFTRNILAAADSAPTRFPELINYLQGLAGEEKLRATVELHKRFAASLACVAFALIAVPLGITAHRKETSVGFALSLIIAFTYFFFIIMADTFRDNAAAHPTILIWVPNILFITLGSFLFWRLSKK